MQMQPEEVGREVSKARKTREKEPTWVVVWLLSLPNVPTEPPRWSCRLLGLRRKTVVLWQEPKFQHRYPAPERSFSRSQQRIRQPTGLNDLKPASPNILVWDHTACVLPQRYPLSTGFRRWRGRKRQNATLDAMLVSSRRFGTSLVPRRYRVVRI